MAKQLTDGEQETMEQARREYVPYYAGYEIEEKQGFRAGFIAGLSYNQVKLDKLTSMLIAAGVSEGIIKSVLQEVE